MKYPWNKKVDQTEKALPAAFSVRTRLEKIETAYCLFLLVLVVSYNVYLDVGSDGDSGLWEIAFIFSYLISFALIVFRLIRKLYFKKPLRPLFCHLLYVGFCTVSMGYHWEVDYAKRYVEALTIFARDGSPCQCEAQQTLSVAVCYVFARYPRIDTILIDPNHEMTKPRDQWRPSTVKYLEARKADSLHLIGDCRTRVDHFYDNVFYVRVRCE